MRLDHPASFAPLVIAGFVLLGPGLARAGADANDLSGGALIVHVVPDITYTADANASSWCAYSDATSCETTRNQAGEESSIWFVISAWLEPKVFGGVQFGFGEFDPSLYAFVAHGPCWPGGVVSHFPSPDAWPGPKAGIGLITTHDPWRGNWVPVYWFAGYPYKGEGRIPLDVFPATEQAGFIDAKMDPQAYPAACLGALGVRMPGLSCCPRSPDSTSREDQAPDSTSREDQAPDSTSREDQAPDSTAGKGVGTGR